eukprot:473527-Rhodomonas_salina.1
MRPSNGSAERESVCERPRTNREKGRKHQPYQQPHAKRKNRKKKGKPRTGNDGAEPGAHLAELLRALAEARLDHGRAVLLAALVGDRHLLAVGEQRDLGAVGEARREGALEQLLELVRRDCLPSHTPRQHSARAFPDHVSTKRSGVLRARTCQQQQQKKQRTEGAQGEGEDKAGRETWPSSSRNWRAFQQEKSVALRSSSSSSAPTSTFQTMDGKSSERRFRVRIATPMSCPRK